MLGDTVVLQDMQNKEGTDGRWTKTGYDYLIKVHGSRGVTQRNRRFLKKMMPFTPALPYSKEELNYGRIVTKALLTPAPKPADLAPLPPPTPIQTEEAPPRQVRSSSRPRQIRSSSRLRQVRSHGRPSPAILHQPVGLPGSSNLMDLLKIKERLVTQ